MRYAAPSRTRTTPDTRTQRDLAGRVVSSDKADPIASSIDSTVKRIGSVYDNFGRISSVRSFTSLTTDTVKNAVSFRYSDDLWHTIAVYQDADSDVATTGSGTSGVPSGNTQVVRYTYPTAIGRDPSIAVNNYSRPTELIYPDHTVYTATYGDSSHIINDRISRVMAYGISASSSQPVVDYSYLGLGNVRVSTTLGPTYNWTGPPTSRTTQPTAGRSQEIW